MFGEPEGVAQRAPEVIFGDDPERNELFVARREHSVAGHSARARIGALGDGRHGARPRREHVAHRDVDVFALAGS